MKPLAYLIGFFFALALAWNRLITQDGLVRHFEARPNDPKGAAVMSLLGKGYEITSNYEKMLWIYEKVLKLYPKSKQAEGAQYGLAFALEKLNRYPQAIAAYETYLEKYPSGQYARSVRNNVEILKSR